ncbi:hypothetical protein QFC20_001294 [Naganishia adeliensis]|uniref:Uncharacterized protein n=1 Tax=Naganishia adeliensis TaxID=92952 RepID=A0ACC2WU22_9TREE|nr:hypothetical protein QFC20_001294 [Naganishia adeliensis]
MSRYIHPPSTRAVSTLSYTDELAVSLDTLVTRHPPSSLGPSGGLYAGLLSVTYLFWKLDKILQEDTVVQVQSLREWYQAYWSQAKRYEHALIGEVGMEGIKVRPWRCGVGDDTVVYAAMKTIASIEDRESNSRAQVEAFCAAARQVVGEASADQERRHGKPASNEWLYGRAGTLYLLRVIRQAVLTKNGRSNSLTNAIDDTIRVLVNEIVYAPRPWIWHGKPYLGAVHGSAGIIAQVLLSMDTIREERNEDLLNALRPDIDQLIDLQLPSGNWPSSISFGSINSHAADRLRQFCHGSPGIVPCLTNITRFYPSLSSEVTTSIRSAQKDIIDRGWLTKEPCLCHGATGNALSLPGKRSRDAFLAGTTERELRKLQLEGIVGESDSGEGLYTGIAGRAWVWAKLTMEEDDNGAGLFLGFDDV